MLSMIIMTMIMIIHKMSIPTKKYLVGKRKENDRFSLTLNIIKYVLLLHTSTLSQALLLVSITGSSPLEIEKFSQNE